MLQIELFKEFGIISLAYTRIRTEELRVKEKAIEKIKTEMTGNSNNPYIRVVGNFILQHLERDPDSTEKKGIRCLVP